MDRYEIIEICERDVLDTAVRLFGATKDQLSKFDDYEGCANLVYQFKPDDQPRIRRISYRPTRPAALIQAELHFVNYVADNGMCVSLPIQSEAVNLVEVIPAAVIPFIAVAFVKGRGMRVPDNGYRYREGVPIKEYFQNWERALGQTHRLTKTYQPPSASIRRPERFAWEYYSGFPYGEQLAAIQKKYNEFMWKV